ncbi:MAG: protein translocase subunit SecD, partial [Pseudomonadota bacterium]
MLNLAPWKKTLILLLCLAGIVLAVPNLFYNTVEQANDARARAADTGVMSAEDEVAAAGWPSFLPSGIVNLGLDLRGGAHLLVEVAVQDVYEERLLSLWPEIRSALLPMRETVGGVRRVGIEDGVLRVRINEADGLSEAVAAVRALTQPVVSLTGVGARDFDVRTQGSDILVSLSEAERIATDTRTME